MDNIHVMITDEESELVMRIARKAYRQYCSAGKKGPMSIEDLYHYGIIGLIDAKKKYDPSPGVPWLAWAALKIGWKIKDAFRTDPLIRLPQAKQEMLSALASAKKNLKSAGMEVNSENLAKKLNWTIEQVYALQNLAPKLVAVETEKRDPNDSKDNQEIVLKGTEPDPEAALERKQVAGLVQKCLKTLTRKYRIILESRVLEEVMLKDLAGSFGCSIESIRQWQKQAQAQIRACLERHGWLPHDDG